MPKQPIPTEGGGATQASKFGDVIKKLTIVDLQDQSIR